MNDIPHDYYDHDHVPHLHGGNHGHFLDSNKLGGDYDAPLPTLSTIGRGPRGFGITAKVIENDEHGFRFGVFDEFGEQLFISPNLGNPYITVDTPNHPPVPGEVTHAYINVYQGDKMYTYDIEIPPGVTGSRLFVLPDAISETLDKTYSCQEDELYIDGLKNWQFHYSDYPVDSGKWGYGSKPRVRVNDGVVFKIRRDDGSIVLAIGIVEAVEDTLVVFTSRTNISIPVPTIGKNGHWYIDDMDTGIEAQGIQGPKGDPGPQGPQGKQGKQGERGPQGYTGKNGIDGRDAKVAIGNVTTVPTGVGASITTSYDQDTNTTTLNFGIPEGKTGRAIMIQSGIWYIDTLPDYDDTPINDAFIVYDGDRQFDLYIRGPYPIVAEDGGPWTVVEDWQGRPGTGLRILVEPYYLKDNIGEVLVIPAAEANLAFQNYDMVADGDIVFDTELRLGVLSSAEDNSGTYEITTIGKENVRWKYVSDKPFSELGEYLNNEDDILDVNVKPIGAAEVRAMIKEITNG